MSLSQPVFCKSVLSGDSLILLIPTRGGPPVEKVLQLSSLSAPRMGSKKQGNENEPFAYDSREFLRRLVVGKQVKYRTEHTNPNTKREFGYVYLSTGEVVNNEVVSKGWAKVKSGGAGGELVDELLQLEAQAQSAGLGVHNTDPVALSAARRGTKAADGDHQALFEKLKGKPQPCVLEHVRTGSNLKVVTPDLTEIQLTLAGVQCPGFKRQEAQTAEVAEPFAAEAKYFTEVRVLQRDVNVLFEGVDKFGNFFGSVTLGQGNIGVEILKAGYGKIVDWSISKTIHSGALRQAENTAKMQRLRLWKDFVPPVQTPANPALQIGAGQKEFTAKVIQIVSGDTMVVIDPVGNERRITLASVRAPRIGNARSDVKDAPYASEAREFLRSKLIGKKVTVSIDFKRADQSNPDMIRECATVKIGSTNFAEELIKKGFATAFKHRHDDNDRASEYDALVAAEDFATQNKRGLHSGTEPPSARVNDITGNPTKAKQFLPYLQRLGRASGVIEYVSNGARFKVTIPKESCLISFCLSGVRCPQSGRNDTGEGGEPFGNEALRFARENCMQHNVEVEVETVDKGGNFLGSLFVNKENFAVKILERGYGSTNFSADRSTYGNQLFTAETLAKTSRIGVWKDYVEPTEGPSEEEQAAKRKKEPEYIKVLVTEVQAGGVFYIQDVQDNDRATVEAKMAGLSLASTSGVVDAKRGAICAAPFEGALYRARIEEISKDGKDAKVHFIDYGNKDVVKVGDLRSLDMGLVSVRPIAHECNLAFVKFPKEENEFYEDAARYLMELALNKELIALVESREGSKLILSLYDQDHPFSINMKMLKAGLATVQKRRERYLQDTIRELQAVQDEARKSRSNMWQYGDIDSDDEDGPKKGAWGRK